MVLRIQEVGNYLSDGYSITLSGISIDFQSVDGIDCLSENISFDTKTSHQRIREQAQKFQHFTSHDDD